MICNTCNTRIAMLHSRWIEGEDARSAYQCKSCSADDIVRLTGTDGGDRILNTRRVDPIEPGLLFASLLVAYYNNELTMNQLSEALRFADNYRRISLENQIGL